MAHAVACVIALKRIGNVELAMELTGAIEAHATLGVAPMTSILHNVAFAARDDLIADLGDTRPDELRAAGAACPVEDIVVRTRRALLGRLDRAHGSDARGPSRSVPIEVRVQVPRQVGRVGPDAGDEVRAAPAHERQPEEVQAGQRPDAAVVDETAARVERLGRPWNASGAGSPSPR